MSAIEAITTATTSTTPLLSHLVQNRWNHIRTIELQYNTDKENIVLKKEILQLKDDINNIKIKANNNLKEVVSIANQWIKATRLQFKNYKIKTIDEIEDTHRSLNQGNDYYYYE